ncbi:MAG: phosphatase PAP2 family protein [Deltaproteobacteria bacterium]|nr:phosphatase PAP2 family protein [Deltaproteobacteria bacterium]
MGADTQIFIAVNRAFDGPAATAFFSAVTWLGNGLVLAAIIVPSWLILDRARMKAHLMPMVVAVALGGAAANLLKVAVDRPRPPAALSSQGVPVHAPGGVPRDRSFPSGHAQTAMGAAAYLSFVYPILALPCLALAALVALSRVALGVHYPSDVAAGALLGAACSVAAFLLARRRMAGRRFPWKSF